MLVKEVDQSLHAARLLFSGFFAVPRGNSEYCRAMGGFYSQAAMDFQLHNLVEHGWLRTVPEWPHRDFDGVWQYKWQAYVETNKTFIIRTDETVDAVEFQRQMLKARRDMHGPEEDR